LNWKKNKSIKYDCSDLLLPFNGGGEIGVAGVEEKG